MKKNKTGSFSSLVLTFTTMMFAVTASAEDGSQLAQAILDAANPYVAESEPPLTGKRLADLESATNAIARVSYYQVGVDRLEEALEPAYLARKAQGPVDRATLAHAGLEVLVDLIGHGAELWKREQISAPRPLDGQPSDRQRLSEVREGPLRIISIPSFTADTFGECAGVLGEGGTEPYEGIVLDLRGNQGGVLGVVASVISQFLEPRVNIFHLESSTEQQEFKTSGCKPSYLDIPLAVVIDSKTDSGALLLAAVLQDHKRAKVIGRAKDQPVGTVHTVVVVAPSGDFVLKIPSHELGYAQDRRLSDGMTVDVAADVTDDKRMVELARSVLGL